MSLIEWVPILAGAAFLVYLLLSLQPGHRPGWQGPALLSAAFLAWTLWAIAAEGPFGFWAVHVGGLWKNQVWFDLLLAAGIGWTVLLPRARAQGMALALWAVVLPLTGSIGLLAMLARVIYLEERSEAA